MPSLEIVTNIQADKNILQLLIKELSAGIASVGQVPEQVLQKKKILKITNIQFVTVYVMDNVALGLAGDVKEPAASLAFKGVAPIEGKVFIIVVKK